MTMTHATTDHADHAAVNMTRFRASLAGFVQRASAGERIAIVRCGEIVAYLVPPEVVDEEKASGLR